MARPNTTSDLVRKIMSATPGEFAQSLSALLGREVAIGEMPLRIPLGTGEVVVSRVPLPGVRLGGLLELPRAEVTLTFRDVTAEERDAFLRRFEIAFQRGGG